jgi:hypothetical protein
MEVGVWLMGEVLEKDPITRWHTPKLLEKYKLYFESEDIRKNS